MACEERERFGSGRTGLGLWRLQSMGLAALAPGQDAKGRTCAKTMEALLVSDIHFDPFLDPGKAVRLAAEPVSEWNAILAAPASADAAARWAKVEQTCPTRGADTSFVLYRSSLQAIHGQASEAKFAIVERRPDCTLVRLQVRRGASQKPRLPTTRPLCRNPSTTF